MEHLRNRGPGGRGRRVSGGYAEADAAWLFRIAGSSTHGKPGEAAAVTGREGREVTRCDTIDPTAKLHAFKRTAFRRAIAGEQCARDRQAVAGNRYLPVGVLPVSSIVLAIEPRGCARWFSDCSSSRVFPSTRSGRQRRNARDTRRRRKRIKRGR